MGGSDEEEYLPDSPDSDDLPLQRVQIAPSFARLFGKRLTPDGCSFLPAKEPSQSPCVKGGINALKHLDTDVVQGPRKRRSVQGNPQSHPLTLSSRD